MYIRIIKCIVQVYMYVAIFSAPMFKSPGAGGLVIIASMHVRADL